MIRKLFGRPKARRVVYTSLFGGYETLNEQPVAKASRIPFVCFSDRHDLKSNTWTIRPVKSVEMDSARESRRPKICAHLFLPEFEESLYIDNSVLLKQSPEDIFEAYLPRGTPNFVCFRHPSRNCVYDEAEVAIQSDMDSEGRIREQMDHYRARGFAPKSGLIAGTFLLRRHNEEDVKKHADLWFSHVLRYSKRDQLSFTFTATRAGLQFTALDLILRENDLFHWPNHVDRLPYGFRDEIYLWLNADVAKAKVEPRKHYVMHGKKEKRRFKYAKPITLNVLANKYRSDKGNLYYNGHYYSRIYDSFLSPMRNDQFTLLEIGLLRHDVQASLSDATIADAPSLFMWSEYFIRAEIHGVDIEDFSPVQGDRILFTQADQSDREALQSAVRRCSYPIKVIIDDGCHASNHQQISLAALFPHLAPGALYFIEDLHYQPSNLEDPTATKTRTFLKMLADGKRPTSTSVSNEEIGYLLENIAEIQFFDSMDPAARPIPRDALAVIRKKG